MRKSIVLGASLLFVVTSAFAQQPTRSNAVSVFVSDLEIGASSSSGTHVDAALGAAFDHMFSDRFSGGISVSSQRVSTLHDSGPLVFSTTTTKRIYPIDANVSYHFFTDSRWKPYVGAGLRYVSETFRGSGSLGGDRFTTHSTNPEVSGGIVFQFRPNLGLRFEAKQVIGANGGGLNGDPNFKASVGLSFRF